MDLGLHVINFSWPGAPASIAPTLGAIAKAAEDAGITDLSVMDHYFQMDMEAMGLRPDQKMLEGYTTLGFLAAKTSAMRLGLLVTGVTYRHPGLLAKIVTTLDILSGGRAQLGIGAAWYEREHAGLGVPFPPLKERFERLEETLQICLQMWSDDNGRSRANTTNSLRRSTFLRASSVRTHRSSSGAWASAGPSGWRPGTPTPAICSPWPGWMAFATNSRCSDATARPRGAATMPSKRPCSGSGRPWGGTPPSISLMKYGPMLRSASTPSSSCQGSTIRLPRCAAWRLWSIDSAS